jgi:hypothetical protein
MGSDSSVIGVLADPSVVEVFRTSFVIVGRRMAV